MYIIKTLKTNSKSWVAKLKKSPYVHEFFVPFMVITFTPSLIITFALHHTTQLYFLWFLRPFLHPILFSGGLSSPTDQFTILLILLFRFLCHFRYLYIGLFNFFSFYTFSDPLYFFSSSTSSMSSTI